VEGRTITCVTVEGHHLAGIIRFIVREIGELVRFEVRSYSRASRMLDSVGMAAVGRRLQKATWRGMVEEVVRRAGGYAASGVEEDSSVMTDREAARIERWIEERVITRRREQESSKLRR
jgi:hypothetical protein